MLKYTTTNIFKKFCIENDIKDVLLVGGSTRVPCVTESVKKIFKKDPVTNVNVDESVSLGAALFSAYKGDQAQLTPLQKTSVNKMSVQDVTCGCFGTIAVRGPNKDEDYVSVLIKKNEKKLISLYESGLDTVVISVYDGIEEFKYFEKIQKILKVEKSHQ